MMLLALIADGAAGGSTWPLLGRLHPLVIHFPIAMILAAAAVELVLVVRRDARPSPIAAFCLWVGTIGACLAAWTGWSFGEEYGSGTTLELHRWFGVACAGVLIAVVVCWCIERSTRANWSFHAYRFGLWLGALLVIVSSFFGGEMVWGEGFLFEESESTAPVQEPPAAAVPASLEDQVAAIMQARCASCHGPEKQKDKLQLYPLAKAFPADRTDRWTIIPGDPDASKVIQRVTLPADHDDIMPPKGDPLSAEQIDVLRKWIEQGAPHGTQAAAQPVSAEPAAASAPVSEPKVDSEALASALDAVRKRGGVISPRHEGSPWYELTASFVRPAWTDADLTLLAPLEPVLWRLDLGNSDITDAGMPMIGRCVQLRTLKLDRTAIGDSGLEDLSKLVHLETLNLYSTRITDAGLPSIERLPALHSLYLWDTGVTAAAADAIQARRPDLDIELGGSLSQTDDDQASADEPSDAAETAASAKLPACCRSAEADGRDCDHACCVQARADGVICSTCPL